MKKIFLFLLSAVLIIAGGMFLQSCESETDRIGIEEFAASLRPICFSELPEGIVPMEFRNMREAKAFFEKLDREREKNPLTVQIQRIGEQEQLDFSNTPRLRSGVEEQLGGSTCIKPHSGWGLQRLSVSLSFPHIGGPVTIGSTMTGFTFAIGWEHREATWSWNWRCIDFTVIGDEIGYAIISSSLFEVWRRTISVPGTFCHQ